MKPESESRAGLDEFREERVREALRGVLDPELGMNIVDLGMVRTVKVKGGQVSIDLVLTAPGCPLSGWIVETARHAASNVPGIKQVEMQLLNEP